MRRVSLFIDETLIAGLDKLKEEHGTPHAVSVRRAIALYLTDKGVKTESLKKKTRDRKRQRT